MPDTIALAPSSSPLIAWPWPSYGLVPAPIQHPEELATRPDSPRALVVESQLRDGGDAWPFTIAARNLGIPFFFVARLSDEGLAISAFRAGATDYFRPPIDDAVCQRLSAFLGGLGSTPGGPHASPLEEQLKRAAAAPSCVLITGETGTGKNVAATRIHRESRRRNGPFVSVNCAAIPDTLVESELFGHERGSFTGAATTTDGKWQQAHGGTLFLDEIGDMSVVAQAKILRALESGEVTRLGARRSTPVDVRIVAATNQDPEILVERGKFRRDLFYRLNVVRLHLAPLRERHADISALVSHFVREMNQRFGCQVEGLDALALDRLARHDWPGNVRELRNVVESIFVDLPAAHRGLATLPAGVTRRLHSARGASPSECERLLYELERTQWNVSRVAHELKWSRMTVYRKMAKYQLTRSA